MTDNVLGGEGEMELPLHMLPTKMKKKCCWHGASQAATSHGLDARIKC
jgi:hypothetical protein